MVMPERVLLAAVGSCGTLPASRLGPPIESIGEEAHLLEKGLSEGPGASRTAFCLGVISTSLMAGSVCVLVI